MIGYLQAYFQPDRVEPGYSLAIQVRPTFTLQEVMHAA